MWALGVTLLILTILAWRSVSPSGVPTNPIVLLVIMKIVWAPVEALLLSSFGTTPGKWLFGIRVERLDGGTLTFSQALTRYILLWVKGEWFGVPVVSAIPYFLAYRKLGRTGDTSWDTAEPVQSRVTHKKWGLFRALVCTGVVLGVLLVYGSLDALTRM